MLSSFPRLHDREVKDLPGLRQVTSNHDRELHSSHPARTHIWNSVLLVAPMQTWKKPEKIVRHLLSALLEGVPRRGHSDLVKVRAIFRWVTENIRYDAECLGRGSERVAAAEMMCYLKFVGIFRQYCRRWMPCGSRCYPKESSGDLCYCEDVPAYQKVRVKKGVDQSFVQECTLFV